LNITLEKRNLQNDLAITTEKEEHSENKGISSTGFQKTLQVIHAHRITCSYRDHCHLGEHAFAGIKQSAGESADDGLREQFEAVGFCSGSLCR